MPEPVTLVIAGIALYGYLKQSTVPLAELSPQEQNDILAQSPAGALATQTPITTVPPGALTTSGSAVAASEGIGIGDSLSHPETLHTPDVVTAAPLVVPADLVSRLDNDTALMFRKYAALNPGDFQDFLDTYADRIVMRNDLMFEMLTNPPEQGFEPSVGMLAGMGNAAYKVVQAFNGVAAGKSVDLFGVGASVAGQIPGINEDFVSSLQGLAMGYRAITGITDIMSVAAAYPGVSILNLGGMTASGITAYQGLGAVFTPGAAIPLAGVLMAVGLVVDIGFTIIGNKPDMQKAVDVALDVASLAVLFIPVIGVVIAVIIQLVKFIIDLFGSSLFGGGMTHEQREILETARYGENINPMYPQLADCYTPREMFRTIIQWGSGYCGGVHVVAMSVAILLKAGDQFNAGGVVVTVPPEMDGVLFGPGNNEQAGGCYWIKSFAQQHPAFGPVANITNDEQAVLIGVYAPVNGVFAMAQAGIVDWRKEQFNDPTEKLIMSRTQPMHDFLVKHRMTLDEIDMVALEYRAQPHLNALASSYGWDTWQELFSAVVTQEWMAFNVTVADGSLADFARQNGFPTMYAFRAAALASYEQYFAGAEQAATVAYQNAIQAQGERVAAFMLIQQQMSASAP